MIDRVSNNLRIKRSFFSLFFAFLFTLVIAAQADNPIEVSASVNSAKIGLEDYLYFTVQVKGSDLSNVQQPNLASIDSFSLLGSSRSTSQHIQMTGATSSVKLAYKYIFTLKPLAKGKFTIPAIKITHGNLSYTTKPISVEVVDGTVVKRQRRRSAFDSFFDDGPFGSSTTGRQRKEIKDEVILERVPAAKTVYVGEQVPLYTYLYASEVNIVGMSTPEIASSIDGFWVEEVTVNPSASRSIVRRNNKVYTRFTLRSQVLFPARPGLFKLDPLSLNLRVRGKGLSAFGLGQNITRRSNPVNIRVLPLPETGLPERFTGAIGKFSIRAALDKNKAGAGQAVNLTVTYSGTGNLKDIAGPDILSDDRFSVYPPEIEQSTSLSEKGWGGSKTWKYILVPKTPGTEIVGPFSFSFFDPVEKRYKTVSTGQLKLIVEEGDDLEPFQVLNPKLVDTRMTDINYIRETDEELKDESGLLIEKPLTWVFILLPFMVNGAVLSASFIRSKREKGSAKYRYKKAYSNSHRALKQAAKYLKKDNKDRFYDLLIKSIADYFADKWNMASGGITIDQIRKKMKLVNPDLSSRVIDFLEECEYYRFAGTGKSEITIMNNAVKEARDILNALEKVMSG